MKHWMVCCILTLWPSVPQGEARYMWTFHPAAQDQTYSMWETPLGTLQDNKPIHDPTGRPPKLAPGDVWSAGHKGRVWGVSPWVWINNTLAELISHWLPNLVNVSSPNLSSISSHNAYFKGEMYIFIMDCNLFSCLYDSGILNIDPRLIVMKCSLWSPLTRNQLFYPFKKTLGWKSIATSKLLGCRFLDTCRLAWQQV